MKNNPVLLMQVLDEVRLQQICQQSGMVEFRGTFAPVRKRNGLWVARQSVLQDLETGSSFVVPTGKAIVRGLEFIVAQSRAHRQRFNAAQKLQTF